MPTFKNAPPPGMAPEVVFAGFAKNEKTHKVTEFRIVKRYEHARARTIALMERVFEYTGDDDQGRRIYRDHTRY